MPCRPSLPISGHSSRGKVLLRSISSARGAIRSWANSPTVLRSMSTSGPRPKSKPAQAFGIMSPSPYNRDIIACRSGCQRLNRARRPALPQQPVDRLGRCRPREQEALHLVAAGKTQQHALLLGLDALDQHRQAERAPERDDRLDDDAAIGRLAEPEHETAVNLELVEREALQIAEIGIAGAEIVERDADTELVQVFDAL